MMRNELRAIVREFAQASADRLAVAIENGVSTKSWRCNVGPLRSDLERAYLASFEQIAGDVVRVEQFLYPHLQVIVANLLPGYRGTVLEAPVSPLAGSLSLAPLADKVTMDLETHWWQHWIKTRRSADEHANQLCQMIENDFLPIVDRLVGDAVRRLTERVEYTMQRANAITGGLLAGIDQRKANLAFESAPLNGADDAQGATRRESEHGARIQASLDRHAALVASGEQLGCIATALSALQTETGRR